MTDPAAIAHFLIEDRLGQGGMGIVYRAIDQKLGRQVALKVLPAHVVHIPRKRRRFLREARAAAAVHHPSIATVYEVGVDAEGVVYIAMELVEGRTLRSVIESDGPLSLEQTKRTMIAVGEALAVAHAQGVIHRDLKDDNVMRSTDGSIKIVDFGIAKLFDPSIDPDAVDVSAETATAEGAPIGTPGYMSPEQVRGETVDARSDIFSAGVLLTKLVSGALPFAADTHVELLAAPLQQDPDLSEVPRPWLAIAARCLRRDPDKRYPDCEALLDDLRAVTEEDRAPEQDFIAAPRPSSRPLWLAAGALAIVAVATTVFMLKREPSAAPSEPTPPSSVAAAPNTNPTSLRHRSITTHEASIGSVIGAISPDGSAIAFSHTEGIFIRDIDSGDKRRIADNPRGALKPVDWLKNSDKIICRSRGGSPALWTVSSDGTREQFYAPAFMAAVSPSEKHVAIAAADGLRLVTPDRNEDRLILSLPRRQAQELGMRWSARGDRLVILRPIDDAEARTVVVETIALSASGEAIGTPQKAFEDPALVGQTAYRAAVWLPDGRFVSAITEPPPNNLGSNLWETFIDPATGKASGPLKRLTRWPTAGLWYASSSRDGKRVVVSRLEAKISVKVATLAVDRTKLAEPPAALRSDGSKHWPSTWRDDNTLIYASDRRGRLDLFAHPVDGDTPTALLAAQEHDTHGLLYGADTLWHWRLLWNDGRNGVESRLMKTSLSDNTSTMILQAALETERFTYGSASPIGAGVRCTPSRDRCMIGERRPGSFIIAELTESGRGAQIATLSDGGGITSWDMSPDGSRIAFMEARLDHATSRMRIFKQGSGHEDVSLDRGCSPTGLDWAGADELFVTCFDDGGHVLMRVSTSGDSAILHRAKPFSEMWQPIASPDGKRLAYRQDVTRSAMWLVEGW